MQELLLIAIGSALVNNVVLSQFLGLCPFLGVSKKVETSAGMGAAVIFVITLACIATNLIYSYVLVPLKLEYLQTIAFILVIAALVQFVEMFLKKNMVSLYESLGVYLPLITTNCAVLGVAVVDKEKCVACGKCTEACPLGLITLVPYNAEHLVQCNSHDKGKEVKAKCDNGCIGCTLCTKQCEFDAIHMDNNVAVIDYEKCTNCGKCAEKCPTKVIL